ncbi:MAG: hypothetical protein AAF399_09795 [Bacteroidota bacterium]
MKSLYVLATVILLCLIGIPALFGSWLLVNDPTGASLGLSPELLAPLPLRSYLWPGLLLTLMLGIPSLLMAYFLARGGKRIIRWIPLQATVFLLWLLAELWLQTQAGMATYRLPLYLVGASLIGLGWQLGKECVS